MPTATKSAARAWVGIALTFYAFIAIGISEGGLGVLIPSILTTYKLTTATVTSLFLSQVSGYAIAAITSSLLTTRLGLAKTLLLASILLTSALNIYAATTHWFVMVAAGSLGGFGSGLIDAGGNTFIANDNRNANLMGLLHAFYGIGALLGPTIATTLLTWGVEWRQVYHAVAGIVSVTIAGSLWAVLHQYPAMQKSTQARTRNPTQTSPLRTALRLPIVWMSAILLLIYVGTEVAIGNWAYTVQHISRGISTQTAGYSIAGYWFGLTIGRLSFGVLVRSIGASRTIKASLLLLIVSLLVWWLVPSIWVVLPILGFALSTIFPAIIWLTPQRVEASIVPAAIGFLASFGSVGAASIPMLVGWIADRVGLQIIPALMIPLAIMMLILHHQIVQKAAVRVN